MSAICVLATAKVQWSRIIAPGRPFVCHLCDAMGRRYHLHHRTRVTDGMRNDLLMWEEFLESYNGVAFWMADLW